MCGQTAITLFLQWSKRLDGMFEKSKTLVPVHLRTKTIDYAVPAKALCSYKTKEAGSSDDGIVKNTADNSNYIDSKSERLLTRSFIRVVSSNCVA